MPGKLKVVTVVGTRPEIIRLSRIVAALEEHTHHVLVHTGQNYDYELNEIFFEDLGMRRPDHFLSANTHSLGSVLGDVLRGTERVLSEERPDAMVVLGDTNSSISALMARRMKIPVYHLEAGNRSFDPNVPEEINRQVVDHVSDYNLVYTEHSRRNLLSEGLHPSRIALMGSPMREVLEFYRQRIAESPVLTKLGLGRGDYVLASVHREENVDSKPRLAQVLNALETASRTIERPLILSTHPRTRKRIEGFGLKFSERIKMHPPLGFSDYVNLQENAFCVVSDSGTISEEASILGFPAVTLRDAIERPEAMDTGAIICTGLDADSLVDSIFITVKQHAERGAPTSPHDYGVPDSSRRVLNFIRSTAGTHRARNGIRTSDQPAYVGTTGNGHDSSR